MPQMKKNCYPGFSMSVVMLLMSKYKNVRLPDMSKKGLEASKIGSYKSTQNLKSHVHQS